MRLKHLAAVLLMMVAALVSRSGFADTLSLESVGGQSAGGYYVYPYNFSFNNSSSLVSMMCLDFNREVTVGESWNVTETAIPTDNSMTSQDYRADAWMYSQLGQVDPVTDQQYTTAEVQYAVWGIFDPSGVSGNSAFDSTSTYLEQQAMLAADNSALMNSGFFSNFTLLSPTGNTAGWTDGTPQRFIAESSAVTPEPPSLLLIGTGLLGTGILLLRRRSIAGDTKA